MKAHEGWYEEKRSAWLYRVVAQAEPDGTRRALFEELAAEADKQALMWQRQAQLAGGRVPDAFKPGPRARVTAALVRAFGPARMRGILAAMKVRGMSIYTKSAPGHFMSPAVEGGEHRHRGVESGGSLRAAVFGANDGLISNASLIMGVAGASADSNVILLTGAAGLVAGAFSMAAGEYVSVRSQREMYEYQIGLERDELEHYPDAEAEELALIYQARGLNQADAERMAKSLIGDPAQALTTLAREELGLNPDDLGNPFAAAAASFGAFAAGALVPLLPFLLARGELALGLAALATAIALFGVGACLSLFTGRGAFAGGLRMLAIGACAGALTYGVGKLLGVSLA
ncbi:MAG: VIT1/CCC1 transporter family protein [Burkholderiales bacterium]|nr:VIT1/CCC1 transporter family protein [Burkholderiales bacterium]